MSNAHLVPQPAASCGYDTFALRSREEEFEVYVGVPDLPPTRSDGLYAAIVVGDALLSFGTALDTCTVLAAAGEIEPVLVIGVSSPRADGIDAWTIRRLKHLTARHPATDGFAAQVAVPMLAASGLTLQTGFGGADAFLDLLAESVLPQLAARYPLTVEDIGLSGHSASAAFAVHALLDSRRLFTRFVIGSFSLDLLPADVTERAEALESSSVDGQVPRVFFGVADQEVEHPVLAAELDPGRRFVESLAARGAIELTSRVFPGTTHASVRPGQLGQGIAAVWSPAAAVQGAHA